MNYISNELYMKDALGRVLPMNCERREGRFVGMFYFLWCGEHSADLRPLDVTKLLASDPKAGYHGDSPAWGAYGTMHHWGEPLYGYYKSSDEWVMRRHIKLLTDADVDFLVLDTTNAVTYENSARMLLRLLSEYRASGFNTPKVVFYTNTASGETAQKIYEAFYKTNFCSDSWFYVDGKPIIIAKADECSPEVREFFTIRASQWPNEATKRGGWPWMDFVRPQRVLENDNGEREIINVSVAQHPQLRFGDSAMYGEDGNCGRSYHDGHNDLSEGAYKYGYNFAEQWERALECDPPYVFVTGWNEWIAGRWGGVPERPLMFVDCCDLEYSRDIEPMRGGYEDNYYSQLISYIRKYKGSAPSVTARTGDTVEYKNYPAGAFRRSAQGYDTSYTDHSGRNEISKVTMRDDGESIIVGVQTFSDIVRYDYHSDWMKLFMSVEGTDKPSACGYNYIANVYQFTDKLTSIAVCTENSRTIEPDTFKIFGQLEMSFEGRSFEMKIPKALLGLDGRAHYTIYFKLADSRREITRVSDFYSAGDCAPLGRGSYVFRYSAE
ncbi:MAG: hypothetical protein WCQ72_08550 [Eubacteriales bacterium]